MFLFIFYKYHLYILKMSPVKFYKCLYILQASLQILQMLSTIVPTNITFIFYWCHRSYSTSMLIFYERHFSDSTNVIFHILQMSPFIFYWCHFSNSINVFIFNKCHFSDSTNITFHILETFPFVFNKCHLSYSINVFIFYKRHFSYSTNVTLSYSTNFNFIFCKCLFYILLMSPFIFRKCLHIQRTSLFRFYKCHLSYSTIVPFHILELS